MQRARCAALRRGATPRRAAAPRPAPQPGAGPMAGAPSGSSPTAARSFKPEREAEFQKFGLCWALQTWSHIKLFINQCHQPKRLRPSEEVTGSSEGCGSPGQPLPEEMPPKPQKVRSSVLGEEELEVPASAVQQKPLTTSRGG